LAIALVAVALLAVVISPWGVLAILLGLTGRTI
jgi:hypothetical protein